jgi:predicted MFS family arabinose efflux permease
MVAVRTRATHPVKSRPRLAPTRVFYGWVVVTVSLVAVVITSGGRAAPGALLVDMERSTPWSTSTLSAAASISLLAYGLAGPLSAAAITRFGLRTTVTFSLVASSVSFVVSARADSLWVLYLGFGLGAGLSGGLIASVLGATVANRWFVERRGLVTGLFGAASSAGLLVFFPVYTSLASSAGWSRALDIGAVLLVVCALPAWWYLRDHPGQLGLAPLGGSVETIRPPDSGIVSQMIRRPEFWLLAATFMVCGGTSNGLVGQHFIAHATDHGFDEVVAANWLAVMGVFNFVGTVASGWLTDRIDPRRLLFAYYTFRGLSLFFLPVAHDDLSIAVFAIFFGLDYIATVPPTIMLCAETFGRHNVGVVYGWVFAAHQLGAAGAAWGAALIRDGSGSYGWAFSAGGGIALAAGMLATMIRRHSTRVSATSIA